MTTKYNVEDVTTDLRLAQLKLDLIRFTKLIETRDNVIWLNLGDAALTACNEALIDLTGQNADHYHTWARATESEIEEIEEAISFKS